MDGFDVPCSSLVLLALELGQAIEGENEDEQTKPLTASSS